MLRIVTDGAADMPPEWEKEFEIEVIPINIQFGEKTYLQYVDLDNAGFYKMVDETRTIPKTSQPSPHQFAEFYKKIAQKGETIISIHVTSKLSGTYASAVQAAADVKDMFTVLASRFDGWLGRDRLHVSRGPQNGSGRAKARPRSSRRSKMCANECAPSLRSTHSNMRA